METGILKFIGKLAILGVVGIVGYNLYKRYKETEESVSFTLEKINLGVSEATEFLKNKNQELEEKIKQKRQK